jgi:endosialidase-like protein
MLRLSLNNAPLTTVVGQEALQMTSMYSTCKKGLKRSVLFVLPLLAVGIAEAQTAQFTYQGKLSDNGTAASGPYDFQFKLFDMAVPGAGTQIGSTLTLTSVAVSAGVFTVSLDFGTSAFPGADRYLEIAVRPSGTSSYTTLSPRQPVTSNPYALRSIASSAADGLSASCAGCVTTSQIQTVQGSQVTGSIAGAQISGPIPTDSVPGGSSNYIQNSTSLQSASNFNISGSGTVGGTVSATQYNIGAARALSNAGFQNFFAGIGTGPSNTGGQNAFFGFNAGLSNTSGGGNSFFGPGAGQTNTTGGTNSFFGRGAGFFNTTGDSNSFFGNNAGAHNTTGRINSFFGDEAGFTNTTGNANSFFGLNAGNNNTTASNNAFFGQAAGFLTTTGGGNSFFGQGAGLNNTTGFNNTFIGTNAGPPDTSTVVSNSTAIGSGARVTSSNTIVLGTGVETTQVTGNLTVHSSSFTSANGLTVNSGATFNSPVSFSNIFAGTGVFFNSPSQVNGDMIVFGRVTFGALPAGSSPVCFAPGFTIAACGSSLRYKTDFAPYLDGMEIITRLNPITFTWKQYGTRDVGLGAEDVAAIEPFFTFNNNNGQVEGVKYDRLSVLFINAFKQQQSQIRDQQARMRTDEHQVELYRKQLAAQQNEIESLKQIVCLDHPRAKICKFKGRPE